MPTTRPPRAPQPPVVHPAGPEANATGSRPVSLPVGVAGTAAGLLTAGCALLAVGHAGVRLPLMSALGPGGDRAVPVAAAIFTVATVAYAVVTRGLLARRRWAWPAGLVLGALTVVGAARPFRGVGSGVGIVLALAIVAALASPAGRRAFGR